MSPSVVACLIPSVHRSGIVVVLFFQCMNALLNPLSRSRGDIKWLLVAHTVVTFLFVTAYTAVNLEILSISYVGNREYTGDGDLPSGPLGYEFLSYSKPIGAVSTFTFLLNNWQADGLLVSSTSNSVARMPNVGRSSSFIVATLFME